MYSISLFFILFLIYSFFGWIVECIYCSFEQKKFCIDRGFLIGPYCPIYGSCALIMMLFLDKYLNDPIALFLFIMVIASLIEYFTSLLMEKLFNVRWWDYSHLPFNIEGRVCLIIILGFGFLGLIFMYVVNPIVFGIVSSIKHELLVGISIFLLLLFLIDCILSFIVITKLKLSFSKFTGDSTSAIDVEVRKFLHNNTYFISRLFKAFPMINISLPYGDEIKSSLKRFISFCEKENYKYKKMNQKNDK